MPPQQEEEWYEDFADPDFVLDLIYGREEQPANVENYYNFETESPPERDEYQPPASTPSSSIGGIELTPIVVVGGLAGAGLLLYLLLK